MSIKLAVIKKCRPTSTRHKRRLVQRSLLNVFPHLTDAEENTEKIGSQKLENNAVLQITAPVTEQQPENADVFLRKGLYIQITKHVSFHHH